MTPLDTQWQQGTFTLFPDGRFRVDRYWAEPDDGLTHYWVAGTYSTERLGDRWRLRLDASDTDDWAKSGEMSQDTLWWGGGVFVRGAFYGEPPR